jgi:hypothetical protein
VETQSVKTRARVAPPVQPDHLEESDVVRLRRMVRRQQVPVDPHEDLVWQPRFAYGLAVFIFVALTVITLPLWIVLYRISAGSFTGSTANGGTAGGTGPSVSELVGLSMMLLGGFLTAAAAWTIMIEMRGRVRMVDTLARTSEREVLAVNAPMMLDEPMAEPEPVAPEPAVPAPTAPDPTAQATTAQATTAQATAAQLGLPVGPADRAGSPWSDGGGTTPQDGSDGQVPGGADGSTPTVTTSTWPAPSTGTPSPLTSSAGTAEPVEGTHGTVAPGAEPVGGAAEPVGAGAGRSPAAPTVVMPAVENSSSVAATLEASSHLLSSFSAVLRAFGQLPAQVAMLTVALSLFVGATILSLR